MISSRPTLVSEVETLKQQAKMKGPASLGLQPSWLIRQQARPSSLSEVP